MDFKADEKSVEKFKEKLEDLGVALPAYQLMEVIFRQTIMASDTSGYDYEKDTIDKSLQDKSLKPERRLNRLREYILNWQNNTGWEYGFTRVHINEIDEHASLVEDYRAALAHLRSVFDQHKKVVDSHQINRILNGLNEDLKEQLKVNNRPTGRYFDEATFALRPQNFDYFSRYVGFSFGIYHSFFEQLVKQRNGDKNNFSKLLSAKLNFECEHNKHIKVKITPTMLADRVKNNLKGYSLLGEEPFKLKLIDEDFVRHLAESQHRLPEIDPRAA